MKKEKESFRSVDQSVCGACNSHACHVTGVCESPKRSMPPLVLVHSHTHGQPGRWQRFLFAFRGFRASPPLRALKTKRIPRFIFVSKISFAIPLVKDHLHRYRRQTVCKCNNNQQCHLNNVKWIM